MNQRNGTPPTPDAEATLAAVEAFADKARRLVRYANHAVYPPDWVVLAYVAARDEATGGAMSRAAVTAESEAALESEEAARVMRMRLQQEAEAEVEALLWNRLVDELRAHGYPAMRQRAEDLRADVAQLEAAMESPKQAADFYRLATATVQELIDRLGEDATVGDAYRDMYERWTWEEMTKRGWGWSASQVGDGPITGGETLTFRPWLDNERPARHLISFRLKQSLANARHTANALRHRHVSHLDDLNHGLEAARFQLELTEAVLRQERLLGVAIHRTPGEVLPEPPGIMDWRRLPLKPPEPPKPHTPNRWLVGLAAWAAQVNGEAIEDVLRWYEDRVCPLGRSRAMELRKHVTGAFTGEAKRARRGEYPAWARKPPPEEAERWAVRLGLIPSG